VISQFSELHQLSFYHRNSRKIAARPIRKSCLDRFCRLCEQKTTSLKQKLASAFCFHSNLGNGNNPTEPPPARFCFVSSKSAGKFAEIKLQTK
jgi:hypothetical protein